MTEIRGPGEVVLLGPRPTSGTTGSGWWVGAADLENRSVWGGVPPTCPGALLTS